MNKRDVITTISEELYSADYFISGDDGMPILGHPPYSVFDPMESDTDFMASWDNFITAIAAGTVAEPHGLLDIVNLVFNMRVGRGRRGFGCLVMAQTIRGRTRYDDMLAGNDLSRHMFSCNKCAIAPACDYAFDPFNVGYCLRDK